MGDLEGEIHSIQGYVCLGSRDLEEVLGRAAMAFERLGFLSPVIEEWLKGIRWDPTETGTVFTEDPGYVSYEIAGIELEVRPSILGWTPKVVPGLTENWLEISLFLRSDDLQQFASFPHLEYYPGIGPALWKTMLAMSSIDFDSGLFLANEAQDGQPWEGQIEDSEKRWVFDLAFIPDRISAGYSPVPPRVFCEALPGGVAFASREAWKEPPWS